MFRPKKPLTVDNLASVPNGPGVYIIYRNNGEPFYVGRSIIDIHRRLYLHVMKMGSKKVKAALDRGEDLQFQWEELWSPNQAEAQLILALGTFTCGNLRRESDPADW